MKRLGVIGTMVWDSIYGRESTSQPVEEWGGIAYALGALEASLPDGWSIVPLIKVGTDLSARANDFLTSLARRAGTARFIEVPEPNTRVTIRYASDSRRAERLRGGVPAWTWSELGPLVHDLDALYVNFISGFEMDLEAAHRLRQGFAGPIYADLHSLFLGVGVDGLRIPRALPDVPSWFQCYDVVQLNEDEIGLVGDDPLEVAVRAFEAGVKLLIVTLGVRGAVYFTTPSFSFENQRRPVSSGPIRTARIAPPDVANPLDPTGCGDVFGATMLSALLRGAPVEDAIRHANEGAARNLSYRGATHLHHHLRGEIVPR